MKKIILTSLCCLLIWANALPCYGAEKQLSLTIDGKAVTFDDSTGYPYITESGRTMLPLRVCLASIGCEVNWNQEKQTVIARKDHVQVQIPVGESFFFKDQTILATDTPAVLKNGRTYLPLRAVLSAYGYDVNWDNQTFSISVVSDAQNQNATNTYYPLTPSNINGGSTGIFLRKQLNYSGFDGMEADITLPTVSIAEKGDCPYVYFGFDWQNDIGNTEAGFQFIEDSTNPNYNKWTVYLRQGNFWGWGNPVYLDQGSTHHLKFYSEAISESQVDLVVELDNKEIIRKASSVTDFSHASIKAVTSMAMSKIFDGSNCFSKSENAKIANIKVSTINTESYSDFDAFDLYRSWKPKGETERMWYGTVECIPSYLHYNSDGSVSIYKKSFVEEF
ncbi:stalk domain-containing protein [Clostridium aminobutyricum]|uniref:Copper amine oxidase-like N-terminal domain-containing protein n=1 Tax=Clostridium aminobutyricum TaxID=33953 RepID=A0A939D6J5_CLOAM|nr:stalk domain-containing protein [Clostridium aminobutyricum]MBN7771996.1 hypothetical protein [Clostridium aminobutyricum]